MLWTWHGFFHKRNIIYYERWTLLNGTIILLFLGQSVKGSTIAWSKPLHEASTLRFQVLIKDTRASPWFSICVKYICFEQYRKLFEYYRYQVHVFHIGKWLCASHTMTNIECRYIDGRCPLPRHCHKKAQSIGQRLTYWVHKHVLHFPNDITKSIFIDGNCQILIQCVQNPLRSFRLTLSISNIDSNDGSLPNWWRAIIWTTYSIVYQRMVYVASK